MIQETKQKKKKRETNHYKNKWLENSEQSCIIPFERCLGNLVCLQKKKKKKKHYKFELWLLMYSRSSMDTPLRFYWLRNKGVQVSICFFTEFSV